MTDLDMINYFTEKLRQASKIPALYFNNQDDEKRYSEFLEKLFIYDKRKGRNVVWEDIS